MIAASSRQKERANNYYNTTTAAQFTAPAFGDGTKAFDGPVSISNSIGSDSYQIIATLQAFNPSHRVRNNSKEIKEVFRTSQLISGGATLWLKRY